jgi:hypothetical protein
MAPLSKDQQAVLREAAQKAIGRMLNAELDEIAHEPLPGHFTGVLALAESREATRRLADKVSRLRRGSKEPHRD